VYTVSVIVPTYNRAPLIGRALASILAQTRPPDEVIVVDDGSTDETASLLRERFPSIRHLPQKHAGVSAARNHGIEQANSTWIALLDSDDAWQPDKLAQQLRALTAQPQHKICHTDEIWIRNGRRVNPMQKHAKKGGHIFRHCLPLCAISPSSVLIHRSLFDEIGRFDPELPACEDYELWLRICSRYPVLYLDQPLTIKYGGHADQLSRQHWGMDRFRVRALERILEQVELSPIDRAAAVRMLLRKIDIYLNGAAKRGNHDEVTRYRAKRERWTDAARSE